jgi:predicted dehydrogenase
VCYVHWYNAPNQGSRIAGNLCHWIDLTIFLLEGKKPVSISISKNKILGIDNSTFIILFDDGSIVTLIPSDYGDGTYGVQEFIKIRNEKLDIRIDDFMHMRLWINGKVRNYYKLRRDKGHDIMYKKFCNSILSNKKSEYTKNDLIYSTSIYLNFIKLYYSDESNMELHFS